MTKWILLLIALGLILVMCFFILAGPSIVSVDEIIENGFLPRAIAWICLLLGVYGMARRRFSPMMMMLLFGFAFFFTYLGQFIFKGIY